MNSKASAISISILIMLVVLAVLLGLTAFFVDQAVIYPLVLMKDADVNLRCFLSLKNFNTGYVNQMSELPKGSLREKLSITYSLGNNYNSLSPQDNLRAMGYSGVFKGNYEEFNTFLTDGKNSVICYARSFGPVYNGFIAIYRENE